MILVTSYKHLKTTDTIDYSLLDVSEEVDESMIQLDNRKKTRDKRQKTKERIRVMYIYGIHLIITFVC